MCDDLYDYMGDNSNLWENNFDELHLNNIPVYECPIIEHKETKLEKMMKNLDINCKKKNYLISKITNMNGDCFFEVLLSNNICDNVVEMRRMVAILFMNFRYVKGFFKKFPHNTLQNLFDEFNTTQIYRINGKDIPYTYDVMCYDLIQKGSWNKLPTHFMMMIISKCYNIKFIIINSNNENIIEINESKNNDKTKEIGLGFLPEFHYVGIKKII